MGTAVAIIASAVISAASSAHSSSQRKKSAKADREARERQAREEQARLEQIERDTRPDEKALGEVKHGADDSKSIGKGSTEFLVPKQTGGLGAKGRSGLGFAV